MCRTAPGAGLRAGGEGELEKPISESKTQKENGVDSLILLPGRTKQKFTLLLVMQV